MLGSAARIAALKQLRIHTCKVLDPDIPDALAAALSRLPSSLQHLGIFKLQTYRFGESVQLPTGFLEQLQQLTCLQLAGADFVGPDQASPALQSLQLMTQLVDLRISVESRTHRIDVSMLPGASRLTCLVLSNLEFDRAALSGKTQLQHLHLERCDLPDSVSYGAVGAYQMLSQLSHLQQLTYLSLKGSLNGGWRSEGDSNQRKLFADPPAAAFSVLTACSRLHHLDLANCALLEGAWQHLFPAGRHLLHLQSLGLYSTGHSVRQGSAAPDTSLLPSCCPGLQCLDMMSVRYSPELLAPLQGLSGLHTLRLDVSRAELPAAEGLHAVSQLTGLKELDLHASSMSLHDAEGLLLQLTQMQRLTKLTYYGPTELHVPGCHGTAASAMRWFSLMAEVGGTLCIHTIAAQGLQLMSRQLHTECTKQQEQSPGS